MANSAGNRKASWPPPGVCMGVSLRLSVHPFYSCPKKIACALYLLPEAVLRITWDNVLKEFQGYEDYGVVTEVDKSTGGGWRGCLTSGTVAGGSPFLTTVSRAGRHLLSTIFSEFRQGLETTQPSRQTAAIHYWLFNTHLWDET